MNNIFQKQESSVPQVMSLYSYSLPYNRGVKYFGKPHNVEKYNSGKIYKTEWKFKFFTGENIVIGYDTEEEFSKYARENSITKGVIPSVEEAKKLKIMGDSYTVNEFIIPILDSIFNKKIDSDSLRHVIWKVFNV